MNLKLFRINRRILCICKVSLYILGFMIIFYFDVPVYELYKKFCSSKVNENYKAYRNVKPKFQRIHNSISDEHRTAQSLEEERLRMQQYHRIYVERLRRRHFRKMSQRLMQDREEEFETYSSDDDDDEDDEEYDDEELEEQFKSESESKEEKLEPLIIPPGFAKLSRFYSLYNYVRGLVPNYEKEPMGWGKDVSRRTLDYIKPSEDSSFSHFPKNYCAINKPFILIIVCSRPQNIILRQSIRLTWAKWANRYNISIFFLMGIPEEPRMQVKILSESNLRRDVILENFDDTYYNLTIKTLLMLRWTQRYCADVPFVLKADDDVYINLENLYYYTIEVQKNDTSKFLVGKVESNAPPFRDDSHKWYVPYYMYPSDTFPNYTDGVAYMMSKQTASQLYQHSLTKEFFYLEDVFITGMCTKELGIKLTNATEFRYSGDPKLECNEKFAKLAIVAHHVRPVDMYRLHFKAMTCSIITL